MGTGLDDDGGNSRGAAYLLTLNSDGTVKWERKFSDTQGRFTPTLDDVDEFGNALANLGDLDGDGRMEIAVGAPEDDDGGTDRGAFYRLELENLTDSDSDGLWDFAEYGDTDGDTTNDDNDADDDGDTVPTTSESADPDGDGEPLDALDSDRDGQPDYRDAPTGQAGLTVSDTMEISEGNGGLATALDDVDDFGAATAAVGDLDRDGVVDLAVGAPGDDDGGTDRGAVHVLLLNADGTVTAEQKISDSTGGLTAALADGDAFGTDVARVGDLDGDGVDDLAVGAPGDDGAGTDRGAVHVLLLNADGTVKAEQKIGDSTGGLTAALADGDAFGYGLGGVGDIDGDGVPDLVIGARGDDTAGGNSGSVYVLFLNGDGSVKAEQEIRPGVGGMAGALAANERFGTSVAGLGDIDADGVPDIAVGVPERNSGGDRRGAVIVFLLTSAGTVKAEQEISHGVGGLSSALLDTTFFGYGAAGVGDLDADGVPDLAVGGRRDDTAGNDMGSVFAILLNTDGTVKTDRRITENTAGFPDVLSNDDEFGASVTGLGDLDGDGAINLAIGAWDDNSGGLDQGAVHIIDFFTVCGAADSDLDGLPDCEEDANTDLDDDPSTNPGPDTDGDTFANYLDADDDGDGRLTSLESADPNGDGDPRDARDTNRDGQPDYLDVEAGPSTTPIVDEQKISDTAGGLAEVLANDDRFGSAVAAIGDVDGDGIADMAAGMPLDDDSGSNRGAVLVLFMNANGTVRAEQEISDTVGGLSGVINDDDRFGNSVTGLGDVDGDGTPDIAVGAHFDDDGTFNAGRRLRPVPQRRRDREGGAEALSHTGWGDGTPRQFRLLR